MILDFCEVYANRMMILRETGELLLRRLELSVGAPRAKRFEAALGACVANPDADTGRQELGDFSSGMIAVSCIENPQQLASALQAQIDHCRSRQRIHHPPPNPIQKWAENQREIEERECEIRQLQNAKIAIAHDIAYLSQYTNSQDELLTGRSWVTAQPPFLHFPAHMTSR
jgi:hypothetical protein